MIEVASLHIYPVKSARGISLSAMPIDLVGPVNDRRWMVIDEQGHLVTQREIAALGQVGAVPSAAGVRLEASGHPALDVVVPPDAAPRIVATVWDDTVTAADAGDPAHRWLRTVLGAPLRLVHFPTTTHRRTDPDYDPIGGQVGFADGFPFLVVEAASLDDLNGRLATPLPMNRFRPNIVVRGATAFAEDGWKRIRIGEIDFDLVKPCARCVVTTTDQDTGTRAAEPLRTLATFRKRGSGVMFGMNAVHRATGSIAVGDPVTIVR